MNLKLKHLNRKLKNEYSEHIKKIHDFFNTFTIKDNYGKIVQSGYQYIHDIQQKILEKYHDEKIIIDTIGEEPWE